MYSYTINVLLVCVFKKYKKNIRINFKLYFGFKFFFLKSRCKKKMTIFEIF